MFNEDVLATGILGDADKADREAKEKYGFDFAELRASASVATPQDKSEHTHIPYTPQEPKEGKDLNLPVLDGERANQIHRYNHNYQTSAAEGIAASIRQMDTFKPAMHYGVSRLVAQLNALGVDGDEDFDVRGELQRSGVEVRNREMKIINRLNPQNELALGLVMDYINDTREDHMKMGDSPVSSFITSMADPIYLVGGGLGATVKTARAPRLTSALAGGAIDGIITLGAAQYNPYIRDEDVAANALFGFGFGALMGGKRTNIAGDVSMTGINPAVRAYNESGLDGVRFGIPNSVEVSGYPRRDLDMQVSQSYDVSTVQGFARAYEDGVEGFDFTIQREGNYQQESVTTDLPQYQGEPMGFQPEGGIYVDTPNGGLYGGATPQGGTYSGTDPTGAVDYGDIPLVYTGTPRGAGDFKQDFTTTGQPGFNGTGTGTHINDSVVGVTHDGVVHQGATPRGGEFSPWVSNADEIEFAYNNPRISTREGVELTVDPTGNTIAVPTGRIEVDTPIGADTVAEIRTHDLAANDGKVGFKDVPFVNESFDYTTGKVPGVKDIDWNYETRRGLLVKRSVIKPLVDIAHNPDLPKGIRAEAEYQLNIGSRLLGQIEYYQYNSKRRPPNKKVVLGYYRPDKRKINVRNYEGFREDVQPTILHEAMHALTAHRIAEGMWNPKSPYHKTVMQLDGIRQFIKRSLDTPEFRNWYRSLDATEKHAIDYSLKDVDEFLSGLAEWGNKDKRPFIDLLEKTELPAALRADPADPNTSVLGALFNALRKLLGRDITAGNALAESLIHRHNLIKEPTLVASYPDGTVHSIKVGDPKARQRVQVVSEGEAEANAKAAGTVMGTVGRKLSWNGHKTVSKWDPEFAEVFLNDPTGSNPGNVQQLKQAYRTHFIDKYRVPWELELMSELKARGVKWYHYVTDSKMVRDHKNEIASLETEILASIENGTFTPERYAHVSEHIMKSVDLKNRFGREALELMVEKGLLSEELLKGNGGYFTRRWDAATIHERVELMTGYFEGSKDPYKAAIHHLGEQMGNNLRYTDLTPEQRKLYGTAIIQRALNQADNVDLVFRGHMGNEAAHAIRQELEKIPGAKGKDIQRIMDIVTGKIDQAGKERWQKSRMDINMEGILRMPDGTVMRVTDLVDKKGLYENMSRYMDDISGRAALADHGIMTTSDIQQVGVNFVRKATAPEGGAMSTRDAQELFNDFMNNTLGRPTGRVMHTWGRIIGGSTQMVALRNSGFWQVTELAKAYTRGVMEVGFGTTNAALFQAFGDYKAAKDPRVARQLHHILGRKSWNETRLRPLADRFEDNHPIKSHRMSAFLHAQGMVYYANGMVAIQRFQSHFAARLLITQLDDAARGSGVISKRLKQHGMTDELLERVKHEVDAHGYEVDLWDHSVWHKVDPILTSIMDIDVLRSLTGDVPLFFQFSETGKILGTFQNFVLTSHNKIMANTMINEGGKAFATLVAMQLPLAMLMTQLSSVSSGRGWIENKDDWIAASLGQMGSFGLIVELLNLVTGNSQGMGSAFTISVDRASDVFGKAMQGDVLGASEAAMKSAPVISLIPGFGAGVQAIMDSVRGEDE